MRSLNLLGVLLGNENQRASRFRSSSGENGNEIFAKCLSWQQKVAKAVLSHKNRLPADQAFLAMEVIVHPKSLLSRDYVSEFYKPHLEEVCKYFKCINIISSVTIGHSLFYKLSPTPTCKRNMNLIGSESRDHLNTLKDRQFSNQLDCNLYGQ